MAALDVRDQPAPEVERLRVRIVDAKHRDALADPEFDDVAQLLPERSAIRRVAKSSGKMSSYFFGGFSAYCTLPSGGARTTADAR